MARILVIEDNPDNLELMSYLLRAFGHEVMAARDGTEGLAAARRDRPELVISDIHLPGLDGYEVARQLKADPHLGAVPRLAVTALAMVGDREKVLAAGFDGYLSKPIDPHEFMLRVESCLPADAGHRDPRSAAPAEAVPPPAPKAPPSSHSRVLAVDDTGANREMIRVTLESAGYAVVLANSVDEALGLAHREHFDCILSDLHMPGKSGYDLLAALKTDPRLAAIPFICITASVWGDQDRQRMLSLGAAGFILRPVEPQNLLDQIAACLPPGKEG